MLRCACWRIVINTGRQRRKDDSSLTSVSPLMCFAHALLGSNARQRSAVFAGSAAESMPQSSQSSPNSSTGCCVRSEPLPQISESAGQYLSHPQQTRSGCFGCTGNFLLMSGYLIQICRVRTQCDDSGPVSRACHPERDESRWRGSSDAILYRTTSALPGFIGRLRIQRGGMFFCVGTAGQQLASIIWAGCGRPECPRCRFPLLARFFPA